jgi:DNA repair and recombination RAD54-like protein
MRKSRNPRIHALHDPDAPDAIVLYDPPVKVSEQDKLQYCLLNPGKKANFEVQVVVDPILAHVLRPHQVEGLKFLFDCTTGFKSPNAFGCIMADEMGLGKTLQCISLLWTLLRQSPVPGKPSIDKAIIACPSSLVKNWGNELKKWLGDKVRPYSCDNKGSKEDTTKDIQQFVSAKGRAIIYPVLIVSYETLRIYTPILKNTEIGLILCDEGHRLKNRESLTYTALNSLNSKRRIILSGTPIQNDLTEYFSLLSFVIPDVLGSVAEFRRQYENPILRGRDADATDKDKQLSEEKLRELLGTANKFIIRRTAELLTKYLPVKYEYVVFCRMTGMQEQLYHYFAKKEMSRLDKQEVVGEKGGQSSLKAITNLKKIVNHPALLGKDLVPAKLLPDDFNFNECQAEYSGKLCLLEQMIWQMRSETKDKIVIISNYTQTLDLIEKMCRLRKWGLCRLDGTMTISKRQKLVDKFNDQEQPEFVFLLSSKAGGCGINLVGANRLILTDPVNLHNTGLEPGD